jgi:hypothetical protein
MEAFPGLAGLLFGVGGPPRVCILFHGLCVQWLRGLMSRPAQPGQSVSETQCPSEEARARHWGWFSVVPGARSVSMGDQVCG